MSIAASAKRPVRYFISYTRDDAPIPRNVSMGLRQLRYEISVAR
jgi:hypothetical protein